MTDTISISCSNFFGYRYMMCSGATNTNIFTQYCNYKIPVVYVEQSISFRYALSDNATMFNTIRIRNNWDQIFVQSTN